MTKLSGARLGQALLIAWAFAAFIQGIAGFGVPVAVLAPIMLILGFTPIQAAVSVLVGHASAITFGSMGSSYYTIQLVTGFEGSVIGPMMALLFAMPIIITGFAVAHIEGGWKSVRKGVPAVLIVGSVMAFFTWLMTKIGAAQLASIVPGLIGCGVIWILSKTSVLSGRKQQVTSRLELPKNSMGFHLAFLPYYLLILLSVVSQIPPIKAATKNFFLGINYPQLETAKGYVVGAQNAYAKISLVGHPAPLILAATLLTFLVLLAVGQWQKGVGIAAVKKTTKQCIPTSIGIATMVMMALLMTSTGMTQVLAEGISTVTGVVFPLFSPFIGVLGTFMTGSNTNSNVMFGALQMNTAQTLGISALIISSIQSVGGSLGSAIAPAKVLIGSTLVGLVGKESDVMRKAIPYCLLIVFLVGVEAMIAIYVLPRFFP